MGRWHYDVLAQRYDQDMGASIGLTDLSTYLELLPPAPCRVLEVGCGTGRLTIPLAETGRHILAVDRSGPMLLELSRKLATMSDLPVSPRQGDAANLELSGRFEAVIFPYSGFQYLIERGQIDGFLTRASELLSPGGALILDIFLHRDEVVRPGFSPDYLRALPGGGTLQRWKRVSVEGQVNRVTRRYWETTARGVRWFETQTRQRLYTLDLLVATAGTCNFRVDRVVTNYDQADAEEPRQYTVRFRQPE